MLPFEEISLALKIVVIGLFAKSRKLAFSYFQDFYLFRTLNLFLILSTTLASILLYQEILSLHLSFF